MGHYRALLMVALVGGACGSEPRARLDASMPPDGASEPDASPLPDGSEPMDASVSIDASDPEDASSPMDASTQMDGSSLDASAEDAGIYGCGPLVRCDYACTSTASDLYNCGACGVRCPDLDNSHVECVNGSCVWTCSPGFADCDGDLGRNSEYGCEAHLGASSQACGACGSTCPAGQDCIAPFVCIDAQARPGENCNHAIVLSPGANLEYHRTYWNNYLGGQIPGCGFVPNMTNFGDVVFSYTASASGYAYVGIEKAAFQHYMMLISDAPCGTTTPALACFTSYFPPAIGHFFPVVANTTYWIYVLNIDQQTPRPLPNPVAIDVLETDCAVPQPASIVSLDPARGTTTPDLVPTLSATFDQPLRDDIGTITISGSLGTSVSLDLAAAGPHQVSLSVDRRTVTVDPGRPFRANETVTVTWTLETVCGGSVPQPSPPWTFDLPAPTCQPGLGGLVGANTSTVGSSVPIGFSWFAAADTSTTGWVYVGGFFGFYRMSKDGSVLEDLRVPGRAGNFFVGRAGLVSGGDVYALSRGATGSPPFRGLVFRFTRNGGQTWLVEDMVQWSTVGPSDGLRGMAESGGRIYLVTGEQTEGAATEIWSFDPDSPSLPAEADLEAVLYDYTGCAGLAMDALHYYTACRSGGAVIRVDRATTATQQLTTAFDVSTAANALQGHDIDDDGIFDVLYLQTFRREGYYICDPTGVPYANRHYRLPAGDRSTYGLAFDPALSVLWAYDDELQRLYRIE